MNKSFNTIGASRPETRELTADELGTVSGGVWGSFGRPSRLQRFFYGLWYNSRRCIP